MKRIGVEPPPPPASRFHLAVEFLLFAAFLYLFLVSIELMSTAFKLAGKGLAERLLLLTSDPLAGLIVGLVATSVIQSSSTTTSITVGLVAAGSIDLRLAIPIVMGANIGTTVTNTIVSLGHARNPRELERAFAASTVHDFFNVLSVLVLFPLELRFHLIEKAAVHLQESFATIGGVEMLSPLKLVVSPPVELAVRAIPHPIPVLAVALFLLFLSLSRIVRIMRRSLVTRAQGLFDRLLFRNDAAAFLVGWLLTAAVQSSSVTTSLVVPLVGTGILTVREIYTYTLGANLGTTITALLASFATANPSAIAVAFGHMTFNILGIAIFYPAKALPIALATGVGRLAGRSRRSLAGLFVIYIVAHLVPVLYVLLR